MSNTLKVLVVDDCPDNAASLARLVELWGYDVRVAHDGAGALSVARTYRLSVVLLDIGLPDLDGCEVARRLRAQQGGEPVLLVAVTGYGQEEDYRRCQEAGFAYHLVKPVAPAVLEGLLAERQRELDRGKRGRESFPIVPLAIHANLFRKRLPTPFPRIIALAAACCARAVPIVS